jgi:hypothetical protein
MAFLNFRLGNVCCHFGAVLYSIIYAMNEPCTAKENQWLATHTKHQIMSTNIKHEL